MRLPFLDCHSFRSHDCLEVLFGAHRGFGDSVQFVTLWKGAACVDLDSQRDHCVEHMPDPPLDRASMKVCTLVSRQVRQQHDDLLRDGLMAGGLKLVEAVQEDVGAREILAVRPDWSVTSVTSASCSSSVPGASRKMSVPARCQ